MIPFELDGDLMFIDSNPGEGSCIFAETATEIFGEEGCLPKMQFLWCL